MTDAQDDPDPWRNRSMSSAAGGAGYAELVVAVRRFQDVVVSVAAPEELMTPLAAELARLTAALEPYLVGEQERCAGRRPDLPGRGHPMLLPHVIDEMTDTHLRARVVFTEFYMGGNGAAHGGTLPLLFDEVLGVFANGSQPPPPSRTAYLHVNYREITPIRVELRLEVTVDRREGRKTWVTGRLFDRDDRLISDAEGLFVKLRPGMP